MNRISTKQSIRNQRSADAKAVLLSLTDCCEWCNRRTGLELHHVAGRIGELIDDIRFLLLLCRYCHIAIEERVMGADSTALGLALLRCAGRGTVWDYWRATGKSYPPEALVNQWFDRVNRS